MGAKGRRTGEARPQLKAESPAASLTAVPDPAIAIQPAVGSGRIELSAANGALFLAIGVYQPFFPVFLAARGLSPEVIGFAAALPPLLKLAATPPIAMLWDRFDRPRAILAVLGLGSAAGFAFAGLAGGAFAILLGVAFSALFWTSIFPLLDTFAVRLGRLAAVDYGRARLWGSAAFVAGNLVAGFALGLLPEGAIVWLIEASFVLFVASTCILPKLPSLERAHKETKGAKFVTLPLVLGIFGAAFGYASHGMIYSLASVHWAKIGFDPALIGALWALGVIAEIVLFTFGAWAVRTFTALGLIALGSLAAIVRWGGMAFDPSVTWLLPLQLLHGLTFGATHLGLIALIAAAVPDRALGRAQGFASTVISITVGLATLAAGPLYSTYGAGAYFASAALGALGLVLALVALAQPQSAGSGGKTRAPS